MNLSILSVRDNKVGAFGRPIFVPSVASAVRSFTDEVNRSDPDNLMYHHSEDFVLYHLGEFDDQDGSMLINSVPEVVIAASAVRL